MKTYTVNDVAQMLDVDQETVRRWIRRGKLETEGKGTSQGVPKKVTEESLMAFASSSKKYSDKVGGIAAVSSAVAAVGTAGSTTDAAGIFASPPVLAATTAMATTVPLVGICGAIAAGLSIAKAIDAAKAQGVDLGDLANGIAATAESYQRAITEKRSQIAKLEVEIKADEEAFNRCGDCLNKIYAAIEDEKTGSDTSREA